MIRFPHFPDPVLAGAVIESEARCAACGEPRGWVIEGRVFGVPRTTPICPDCVASGEASRALGVAFNTVQTGVSVDGATRAQLSYRTPPLPSATPLPWPLHCGTGRVFTGFATGRDLHTLSPLDRQRLRCTTTLDDAGLDALAAHTPADHELADFLRFVCPVCQHVWLVADPG